MFLHITEMIIQRISPIYMMMKRQMEPESGI